jgi:hypothetical protein
MGSIDKRYPNPIQATRAPGPRSITHRVLLSRRSLAKIYSPGDRCSLNPISPLDDKAGGHCGPRPVRSANQRRVKIAASPRLTQRPLDYRGRFFNRRKKNRLEILVHLHHPLFRPLAYDRVTTSLSAIIALVARTMDSNNMSAASLPATIACGDGIAPLSRIAPQSGCSRCRRTRGMAASDRSYRQARASETASGLQWSQAQRKFSLEIPFVRTLMSVAVF